VVNDASSVASARKRSLERVGKRIDERRSPVIWRPDDDFVLEVAELFEAIVGNALELGPDDARLAPFAVLAEGNLSDDRIKGVGVHVVSELVPVEAAGRLHGLGENLTAGVAEWRIGIAQRIAEA
jgi:hypothetical protein